MLVGTTPNVTQLQISTTAEQVLIDALRKASQPYITPELQIEMDEFFRRCEGLFVGQLNPYEREAFQVLVSQGFAQWSYEGASGFLGLAKVKRT